MQSLHIPVGPRNPHGYTAEEILRALRGVDGTRQFSFRYELLDAQNRKIGDLATVMGCTISQNWLAQIKRTASFLIRADGQIDYLSNRIKPWVRLHMPRRQIPLPFVITPDWANRFNGPAGEPVTVANSGHHGDNLDSVSGVAVYDDTWSADGQRSVLLGAEDGTESGTLRALLPARQEWALRAFLNVPAGARLVLAVDGAAPDPARHIVIDDIAGEYRLGGVDMTAYRSQLVSRPMRLEMIVGEADTTYRLYWTSIHGTVPDHVAVEPTGERDPAEILEVTGGGPAPGGPLMAPLDDDPPQIEFVGESAHSANATQIQVPWPGGVQDKDLALLMWTGSSGVQWTPPAGWFPAGRQVGSTGTHESRWYWRVCSGDESGNITLTHSGINKQSAIVAVWRNTHPTSPIDTFNVLDVTTSDGSPPNPSVTTGRDGCVVVTVVSERLTDSTPSYTAPLGYVKRAEVTPVGGGGSTSLAVADDGLPTGRPKGTIVTPPNWTGGQLTNNVITWTISLRPRPPAPPPPGVPIAHTGPGNVVTASSSDANQLTAARPANTTNGDLLWAVSYFRNAGGAITPPPGWSTVKFDNGNATFGVYVKPVPTAGAEPADYTFATTGGGSSRCVLMVGRISGADLDNPVDAVGDMSVYTGTDHVTLPSVTVGQAGCLLLGVSTGNVNTNTPPGHVPALGMSQVAQQSVTASGSSSSAMLAQEPLAEDGPTGDRVVMADPAANNSAGFLFAVAPAPAKDPGRPAVDNITVGVPGPTMALTPPETSYVEWPQGVFLLSTPTREADAADVVTRDVEGYDQLQVYADDLVPDRYTVPAGVAYTDAVAALLGPVDKRVTPHPAVLPTAKEWEPGTSKLAIINELLDAINYESLSFDEDGVAVVVPYVPPSERPAEYTYADDAVSVMSPEVTQELDLFEIPNRWVLVVSDPDREPLRAVYTNNDPASPTSTIRRQRIITDFRDEEDAADQAALDAKVARLAFEASQVYEAIEFSTGLMPIHSGNDVYRIVYSPLAVNATYSEHTWEMTLEAGAEMKHRARRVVNVSDTTGG